jgi:hypothetical protein
MFVIQQFTYGKLNCKALGGGGEGNLTQSVYKTHSLRSFIHLVARSGITRHFRIFFEEKELSL